MTVFAPLIAATAILAQATAPQVRVWKSGEIESRGTELAKKLNEQKVATETVATEGNRSFMVAHREGSGLAEVHDHQADVMVIRSGEVTMVYGGTLVDAKTTAAGESRGSGIKGGTEVKLAPGDILHIPAKVPHQMKLAPGAKVTYFVTKVTE